MRILVLWSACTSISREEDARWAREESGRLRACDGVREVALHAVQIAAMRYPRSCDWCLELAVEDSPNAVVRSSVCSAFLADLRLLGTKPSVLVLPEASA